MQLTHPLHRLAFSAGLYATLIASVLAGTVRIDFGPSDGTNGNSTTSPDANGRYWNNMASPNAVSNGLTLSNLMTISNAPTSLGVAITSGGWKTNGILNGGLLAPSAARLGELAIATATQDYFFIEGAVGTAGTLKITGLDPAKFYNLRMFGTRNTTDIRKSTYTATGGNGIFTSTVQTSGTDIGSDGAYDGNDNHIVSFNGIQCDTSAQIQLQVAIAAGGFSYLAFLEITEATAPTAATKTVRIDLGRNNGVDGNPTTSPDANGSFWNNFAGDFSIPTGASVANLTAADNTPTSLSLALTSAWSANGILNGGLLAPTAGRLGEFAVATATQDYFFVQGATATGTMKLTGLNPARLYQLRFFGTRATAAVRKSNYLVTAGNGNFTGTLQTSGTGIGNGTGGADGSDIYDGNNRNIVTLGGIQCDSTQQVNLQLSVVEGDFAYLGVLEIVEGAEVPPLPPITPPPVAITDTIERWVAQDALDPLPVGPVLFVGSSSVRRWESLTRDFADYRIVQRGFGGSQFSDLNGILNKIVIPYQPSAIVVWEGTNDIRVSHKSGETVLADFKTFITNVRAQVPGVPICYLGITPCPSFFNDPADDPKRRTANSLIAAYCASDPGLKLHFFDTASYLDSLHDAGTPQGTAAWNSYFVDDTHLNRAGYQLWLSIVRPALLAVIAPNKAKAANPNSLLAGEKLLFDFGPGDLTNGDSTTAADANGNKWNNWHLTNGGGLVNSGEHLANLVRSNGTGTGIRMTITAGFQGGGKAPGGGLFLPSPAMLGDLAVETATEDYWYSTADDVLNGPSDDLPGGFMLEGLNPALIYEFRFLGSRSSTESRLTEFKVFGSNVGTVNLKTSGTGIGATGGNANDDELAVVKGIQPDAFGQAFVDLTLLQGSNTHLNAMEITASAPISAYQSWRAGVFTAQELANPALEESLWGDHADADGDGRGNLLEYAAGTDPRAANPGTEALTVESAGQRLTLTFRKNLAASDLIYQVQTATDLAEWSDISDTLVSTASQIETRKASVTTTGFPRRSLRLRIQRGLPAGN